MSYGQRAACCYSQGLPLCEPALGDAYIWRNVVSGCNFYCSVIPVCKHSYLFAVILFSLPRRAWSLVDTGLHRKSILLLFWTPVLRLLEGKWSENVLILLLSAQVLVLHRLKLWWPLFLAFPWDLHGFLLLLPPVSSSSRPKPSWTALCGLMVTDHGVMESLHWEGPLGSAGPTINLTLPSPPLSHILKCYMYDVVHFHVHLEVSFLGFSAMWHIPHMMGRISFRELAVCPSYFLLGLALLGHMWPDILHCSPGALHVPGLTGIFNLKRANFSQLEERADDFCLERRKICLCPLSAGWCFVLFMRTLHCGFKEQYDTIIAQARIGSSESLGHCLCM